jgi:hypothetical protein
VFSCSPSPSLKTKQISSQENLGSIVSPQQPVVVPAPNQPPPTRITPKDDASIDSGSSGFGSLTKDNKKKPDNQQPQPQTPLQPLVIETDQQSFISSIITDSGISESSSEPPTSMVESITSDKQLPQLVQSNQNLNTQTSVTTELGHSRNSSNTSQVCFIFL